MLSLLFVVGGIAALAIGGDTLIRGALAAARLAGVSPLLAGLVIVGFGTSTPELVVSIDAALHQRPDIAVGNVVGSNIANILLILGLCALVQPMAVNPAALKRDGAAMIGASVLFVVLAGGAALGRADALLFLAAFVGYVGYAYFTERKTADPAAEMHLAEAGELGVVPLSRLAMVASLVGGLVLLIVGSRLLVTGAVDFAESFGVPEAVVGLTVVAVGTSLPELTVSLIAALRRHADVAVGNILGSNVFNLLGILGVSAVLQPLRLAPRIVAFDQWMMLGSALLLTLFLFTGLRLSRVEGGALLAAYVGYLGLTFTMYGG